MTLYNEVLSEQRINQRLGRDASFNFALCAVIERRLSEMKHEINTRKDPE